ncbi:hypothetical protein ACH4VS_31335 [Streptomyces hygroscopicus]|uniref:hypothetical protein n=1 Tax=Streptomyces hygroscopicus TaxID=1912 RepID=UPI000832B94A|nr:hypothetical protein [Streptomyces hygroscopicus]GLV77531.1 hypothetical protein Shyhy02_55310 [Streptomyces hygroscopicus subsp. hygroscopicus]
MTTQPIDGDGPLVPMPALTREALREAVRHIKPLNLTQFDRELGEAFDQSVQTGSIGWMRGFLIKWATFVAIERWPARAASLREAERVAEDPSADDDRIHRAQREIARILGEAEREAGL